MASDVVLLERAWPPATTPDHRVSQIGGWPNLPEDLAWPQILLAGGERAALDFLAQIDLAELPKVSQRGLLPETGTLYFFALSQSHVPLAELGPDAVRVLYFPGDAGAVPRRRPPPDAGWNQDELHHVRTVAAEFRHSDAPRGALLPRCPVLPRAATAAGDEVSGGADPAATVFDFRAIDLPRRVEDAVLHINFARNFWRDNILPFACMRVHFTRAAETYVEFEGKPLPNGSTRPPRPRPAHVDNCLSDAFWIGFEVEYMRWRARAAALSSHLLSLGRTTMLNDSQRGAVRALVAEAEALTRQVAYYGLRFGYRASSAAQIAVATLLLDHPEVASEYPDEVLSVHPGRQNRGLGVSHRMLGPPRDVQGGTMDGPDPILLLQLDSDAWGPRLSWWDDGNLTFWISGADAAAQRFDRARAEIEGH